MSRTSVTGVMTAVVLGATILITSAANAQEGRMRGGHERGMMRHGMERHDRGAGMAHGHMMAGQHRGGHEFFLGMREELELTDEQVERLRSLKSDTEKQMIRAKADLEIAQTELHDLLSSEDVDRNGIDAKIDEIGRLQTEMHKAHVHATLDAEAVLTPEQRERHRQHMRSRGMQEMRTRERSMERNKP